MSLLEDVRKIVFEGMKVAPSLSHVLKSHGWKKHRETPVYDYYSHPKHPGREIGTPVRARNAKGMWYHHAPEHKEPESAWEGRHNEFFGRGTKQLKDHLDAFHGVKESVEQIDEAPNVNKWPLHPMSVRYHHVSNGKSKINAVGSQVKHVKVGDVVDHKKLSELDKSGHTTTWTSKAPSPKEREISHAETKKYWNDDGSKKTKNESVKQIDELSKKTLGSYIRKAHVDSVTRSNHRAQDVADRRDYGYKSGNTSRYDKRIATADRKLDNREVGTRRAVNRLTKEDNVIDRYLAKLQEGRGRPRKDGSKPEEEDSADNHILMQLRKVVSLRGQKPVKFGNGEVYGIHPSHAYKAIDKYSKLKKADDKESFVKKLGHSRGSFFQAMQEEYEMITEAPKWSNMYLSDFKNHAKEEGHTITRSNPHGRGNGNLYTSTDNNSNIHGKFDDFTQSGYYHGRDGRNKSLNRKKL